MRLTSTITVVVVPRNAWLVDRKLLKVWPVVTVELCVQVRKDAALQQRVVGKIDTPYNVTRLVLHMQVSNGSF